MGAGNSETRTLSQLYCHFLPLGQLFFLFNFLMLQELQKLQECMWNNSTDFFFFLVVEDGAIVK